ncbi:MAG TPA: hypothetical protein VK659_08420 [Asanoa sp.]|nr:hypothetical protein [Asanoa sp.]
MPFRDPIVAGNTLVREAIRSVGYTPGVQGWTINRDGSAEFNDVAIRGTLTVVDVDGSYVSIFDEDPGDGSVIELGLPTATGPNLSPARIRTGVDPYLGNIGLEIRGPTYGAPAPTAPAMYLSPGFLLTVADSMSTVVIGDWEIAHDAGGVLVIKMQLQHPSGLLVVSGGYDTGTGNYNTTSGNLVTSTGDVRAGGQSLPRGIIGAAQATALTGTATTAGASNVEVRDAVLGDYTFTADATRLYVVKYPNVRASVDAAATPNLVTIRVRDGGAGTPTVASPMVAEGQARLVATGGPGQASIYVESIPLTFSTGTHTLGAFIVAATAAGTVTPLGNRALYAADIGT